MSTEKKLDSRLLSALPYLTAGGVVADIGTDHAYLPIEALRRGISDRAVACDINLGPIRSAERNISAAGMSDRIDTLQTDGLHGVERFHPTDIVIFGMGGELITDILARAPFVKRTGIRLILQPMTHPEALRRFLLQEGFSIVGESLVKEEKIYQVICAEFSGQCVSVAQEDSLSLLVGEQNLARRDGLTGELVAHWQAVLEKQRNGKAQAGSDASREEALLKEIGEWQRDGQ